MPVIWQIGQNKRDRPNLYRFIHGHSLALAIPLGRRPDATLQALVAKVQHRGLFQARSADVSR